MRAISKGKEPNELVQFRAQSGAVYDGNNFTPVKNKIRNALLDEQGYLCAYCMKRIDLASMKIEHWHCQTKYPSEQLVYANMLGCCNGNESQPCCEQHCDTRKKNKDISFNPADRNHHQHMQIRYSGDGTIRSDNPQFDHEINSILNLNWVRLRNNRKAINKAVEKVLSSSPGSRTSNEIQKLISLWQKKDGHNQFKEFFPVAIYYLEKRL